MPLTALEIAISNCDLETVIWLLQTEPEALTRSNYKRIFEHLFAPLETMTEPIPLWPDVFDQLLRIGVKSGLIASAPGMPENVVQFGNVEHLKNCIAAGFTLGNLTTPVHAYNLHLAVYNKDEYVLNYLIIDKRGEVDAKDSFSRTLLHVAVEKLWYETAKQLIRLGANPNLLYRNRTPLTMVIAKNGFVVHKIFHYLMHRSSLSTICDTMKYARERLKKEHMFTMIDFVVFYHEIDLNHPCLQPVFQKVINEEIFVNADYQYRGRIDFCQSEIKGYQEKIFCDGISLYTVIQQLMQKNYGSLNPEPITDYFRRLSEYHEYQKRISRNRGMSYYTPLQVHSVQIQNNYEKAARYVEIQKNVLKYLGKIVNLHPDSYHLILKNILKFLPRHEIKRLPHIIGSTNWKL